MKTILHIAEAFGGGILTFVANLANEQSSKYNVVVAHGMRYETHKDYKRFFKENIKLVRVENFDYFDQKISIRKEFAALKELRRVICKVKPDIIHMHSSQSGVLGKLASWDYKVPKVYSPHGFAFLKQDTAKWKKWFYKLIEKAFAMGNCTLVASSKTEFEEARKITRKAVLIKNGIGMAGAVVTVAICAVPVLQMLILAFLYKLAAALVQPVSDKRITGCIGGVSEGYEMMVKIIFASGLMFLLTVAVVAASTS